MGKRAFGELEGLVLKILSQKKSCSVLEVQEALGNENAYTTILTVLKRMTDKKMVERIKKGRCFYYALPSDGWTHSLLTKIKSRLLGVKPSEIISFLLEENATIDEEELKKIDDLLNIYRQENAS